MALTQFQLNEMEESKKLINKELDTMQLIATKLISFEKALSKIEDQFSTKETTVFLIDKDTFSYLLYDMDEGDSTLVVNDSSVFPDNPPFYLLIDNEVVEVSYISKNTLTIERGILHTQASTHSNNTPVYLVTLETIKINELYKTYLDNLKNLKLSKKRLLEYQAIVQHYLTISKATM